MLQMNVGQIYFDQISFPVSHFFLVSFQKATLAKIQILARSPNFASLRYFPVGFLEAVPRAHFVQSWILEARSSLERLAKVGGLNLSLRGFRSAPLLFNFCCDRSHLFRYFLSQIPILRKLLKIICIVR